MNNASGLYLRRREFLGLAAAASVTPELVAAAGSRSGDVPDGDIDAHVHVWSADTGRYPLKPGFPKEKMRSPSFTPEDLFAHTRPAGVGRVVLIQMSYYGYDNSYMLDMMRAHKDIFSGVAVIDPDDSPKEKISELVQRGVRGFRISPGQASPDRWLDGDGMATMWQCAANQGLAMCPLLNPEHLPALDRMAERFPDTPVVIDHLARIGVDGQFRESDIEKLCALRRHKKVHVKVSAFSALGLKRAPYLDLAPLIRRVFDAFGPERLMWATDGPWQMMGGHRYIDSIDLIRSRLGFLTDQDRQWILRKTAEKVFFQPA